MNTQPRLAFTNSFLRDDLCFHWIYGHAKNLGAMRHVPPEQAKERKTTVALRPIRFW